MKQLLGAAVVVLLSVTVVLATSGAAKEPMFIRWLNNDDPSDQAIKVYWEQVKTEETSPAQLVDLGTMLFYRGYPKDAVRMFKRALDKDKKMYEAWFRIGLVYHREGDLVAARRAYRKCLKELTGHGWCNFYMGMLHEQTGHPVEALNYYRRAFKFAPELTDPQVNPELLYTSLTLGASLRHSQRERFTQGLPMPYLEPERVAKLERSFMPTPTPQPQPPRQAPNTTRSPSPAATPIPQDRGAPRREKTEMPTPRVIRRFHPGRTPAPAEQQSHGTIPEPEDQSDEPSTQQDGSLPFGVRDTSAARQLRPLSSERAQMAAIGVSDSRADHTSSHATEHVSR